MQLMGLSLRFTFSTRGKLLLLELLRELSTVLWNIQGGGQAEIWCELLFNPRQKRSAHPQQTVVLGMILNCLHRVIYLPRAGANDL